MKLNTKFAKGFTLIELLVVVAIISLLSSIVLAAIRDARDKAQGTAFRQQVNEFVKAIELYRVDNNGNLPKGFNYMQSDWEPPEESEVDGSSIDSPGILPRQALQPYIQKFPKPPFTGGFGYFGQDIDGLTYYNPNYNNSTSYTCGDSNYFIHVEGAQNIKYFTDWISASGIFYDEDFGVGKCFPLN